MKQHPELSSSEIIPFTFALRRQLPCNKRRQNNGGKCIFETMFCALETRTRTLNTQKNCQENAYFRSKWPSLSKTLCLKRFLSQRAYFWKNQSWTYLTTYLPRDWGNCDGIRLVVPRECPSSHEVNSPLIVLLTSTECYSSISFLSVQFLQVH